MRGGTTDMLDISSSDLDVERLMHEIRNAVARENTNDGKSTVDALPQLSADNSRLDGPGSLKLQPAFQARADNQYHINDLVRFHGADFVRNAYRALLLREPDEVGFAEHLENLESGRFNKIDVLASLRASPEGQQRGVRVEGLSTRAAIRRLGRLPFIGYFFRIVIAVGRLPVLLRHQNQFEFYLWSLQQRIVDHQNHGQKALSDGLAQVRAQMLEKATEQQQSIELSLRQHQELVTRHNDLQKTIEAGFDQARRSVEDLSIQTQQLLNAQQQFQSEQHHQLLNEQQALGQQQKREREERLNERQQTDTQLQKLAQQQQRAHDEVAMQERRLTVLLQEIKRNEGKIPGSSFAQLAEDEEEHMLDGLYAAFEDQFRGERDEIRQRLQVYIPILKNAQISGDVLDVGCGRGEFLELLNGEGIKCRGLDHNRIFVEECSRAGLDVVEADALIYLRSLPSDSLNAVASLHLVEHLQFEILIKLLDEIVRVLRPGGLLILETPNPQNFMVGSCNFYADPTHRHPIPSDTLQFLVESRGLHDVNVVKLRPWDAAKLDGDSELIQRFNEYFYSAPDYALIASKPLSSPGLSGVE